jgi:Ca-activated chloride channel homolog
VVIDELPDGARVVEARSDAARLSAGGMAGPPDYLALDDAAWAIVPPTGTTLHPARRAGQRLPPERAGPAAQRRAVRHDARGLRGDGRRARVRRVRPVVFDGFLPPELPAKPILAFAPPRTSPLGEVKGTLDRVRPGPAAGQRAAAARRRPVAAAHRRATAADGAARLGAAGHPRPDGPLLYAGLREGLPTAVFAFDLRQSDLPLQVAWPILVANLAGELLGLGPTRPTRWRPPSRSSCRSPPARSACA